MKKSDTINFLVYEMECDEDGTRERVVKYSVTKDGLIYIDGKMPNKGLRCISAELLRNGRRHSLIYYGYKIQKLITPVSYRALLARLDHEKWFDKEVTTLLAKNYMK